MSLEPLLAFLLSALSPSSLVFRLSWLSSPLLLFVRLLSSPLLLFVRLPSSPLLLFVRLPSPLGGVSISLLRRRALLFRPV
ncbi:hypothetical protein [Haladaptatus sp. T7]|uniref:hypothetical protein n=1 Tax=Haladaptatus sp. T7 TaxID=2029368 RepID=UPI00222E130B|nr:hypothetical protein [Haladaptatus sp. T7]